MDSLTGRLSRTYAGAVRADPTLQAVAEDNGFQRAHVPRLLLDDRLVIRGVNAEYLRATDRDRDELLGTFIFDAFPENPDDPTADGVRNLTASLETALGTGRPHDMFVQRYDVPTRTGGFALRYWSPSNIPVLTRESRRPVGIVHTVEDVTRFWAELLGQDGIDALGAARPAEVPPALARAIRRNARARQREVSELEQLRVALASRVVIEQAKGILMARHQCSPDDAFAHLRHIARGSQRSLHEVARELVRQVAEG